MNTKIIKNPTFRNFCIRIYSQELYVGGTKFAVYFVFVTRKVYLDHFPGKSRREATYSLQ
jgi:hypothetical protein